MRVLIDGRALSAASATRGIGRYVANLVTELAAFDDLELKALVTEGDTLPRGVHAALTKRRSPNRLNYLEQSLLLPRDIRRNPADVFHSPGTEPPRHSAVPWVQTLHDVIPVVYDHPLFAREARRWTSRARRIRAARAVIANSSNTAADGVRVLGIDPDRITVIPMGVDAMFTPPQQDRATADPPFVLYVSEYGPNKGFPEAFEVISALAARGLPHRLKMVGHMSPKTTALVQGLAAAADPERVDLLGRVSPATLVELYRTASAVVVTSRYEGFGFPVLEGMACGAPVVSFDNSSLPEVAGDAGVLVKDGDVSAFVDALCEVLTSSHLADELSAAGPPHAAQFRWDECARRTVAVYRDVVSARG